MANEPIDSTGNKKAKAGKKSLLIGVLAAIFLGGGGFYATFSGLVLAPASDSVSSPNHDVVAFFDAASSVVSSRSA